MISHILHILYHPSRFQVYIVYVQPWCRRPRSLDRTRYSPQEPKPCMIDPIDVGNALGTRVPELSLHPRIITPSPSCGVSSSAKHFPSRKTIPTAGKQGPSKDTGGFRCRRVGSKETEKKAAEKSVEKTQENNQKNSRSSRYDIEKEKGKKTPPYMHGTQTVQTRSLDGRLQVHKTRKAKKEKKVSPNKRANRKVQNPLSPPRRSHMPWYVRHALFIIIMRGSAVIPAKGPSSGRDRPVTRNILMIPAPPVSAAMRFGEWIVVRRGWPPRFGRGACVRESTGKGKKGKSGPGAFFAMELAGNIFLRMLGKAVCLLLKGVTSAIIRVRGSYIPRIEIITPHISGFPLPAPFPPHQ